MTQVDEVEVVVVGAGLAGLQCARELAAAGRRVRVLDAADAVGGRVRTEQVDGFLVDRGFQLLNPAYPAVRRSVDVDALALQAFGAGVATRDEDGGLLRLGLPWREPGLLADTLRVVGPETRRLPGLVRWGLPLASSLPTLVAGRPPRRLRPRLEKRADMALSLSLDHAGLEGRLRRVVDAFVAGVVLDDSGETSTELVRLLVSSFLAAVPGLPRGGMQALPEQLAADVRAAGGEVTPGARAHAVETTGSAGSGRRVRTDAGDVLARSVVVAAGPGSADLAGSGEETWQGVATAWWSCSAAPTGSDLLHVDSRERPTGPLANCAVVSNAAPSYAPAGRHLVQGSALLGPGRVPTSEEMERHARELLGAAAGDRWELLTRHEVPQALPRQVSPLHSTRPVAMGPGLLVAGDHRDTASIQGAMVSGHRAARAVLAELAAG